MTRSWVAATEQLNEARGRHPLTDLVPHLVPRIPRTLAGPLQAPVVEENLAGPLRARLVTTLDGLRKIGTQWGRLHSACETGSPFMTHAWATSWYECFGDGHELYLILVEDDRGPCALAPFVRVRRHVGPVAFRSLELLGTGPLRYLGMGLSDRSDFLLTDRVEESLEVIFRYLASQRQSWDIVDLRFIPESSPTLKGARRLAAELELGCSESLCSESPFVPLTGSYDQYLGRRSRNFRSGIRRKERRLSELGELRWELDAGTEDPEAALRSAFEVSARSWKAGQGSGLFTHPEVRVFFSRLIPRLTAERKASIAVTSLDGRPIAYEILFRAGDELWSYDHCYDQALDVYSPGHLLTGKIISQAFDDGVRAYDFLRGDEDYKLRWLAEVRREHQLVLDTGTLPTSVIRALNYRGKWLLKRSASLCWVQARTAGLVNRFTSRFRTGA